MDQDKASALLGRPLTSQESTNFDLYLDIARESIEELLCISLAQDSGERVFEPRNGYSTIFTGIFTDIQSVKVNNEDVGYHPANFDQRDAKFYNSIVLDEQTTDEVTIDADWGFDCLPSDLEMLWAQAFANVSKKYVPGAGNVKRKGVEDFSVWYGDLSDDEAFTQANARIIRKYSLCTVGNIQSGGVCDERV